jgi:hypothetical protein
MSPEVQNRPSLQTVPLGALVWAEQPVAGAHVPATWQTSVAAGQVTTAPPLHTPVWQVSPVVQRLLSLQVVPSTATVSAEQPVAGEQVPATWQESEAAGQVIPGPAEQVPRPLQMSFWVQALPSLQVVPLGAFGVLQVPVAGLQVPARWQESEAVQVVAVPTQWPAPSQWSDVVQALPSSQVVVVGALPAQGSFALLMVKTCEAVK